MKCKIKLSFKIFQEPLPGLKIEMWGKRLEFSRADENTKVVNKLCPDKYLRVEVPDIREPRDI